MTLNEITRVQEYLRLTFSNNRIKIMPVSYTHLTLPTIYPV